MLLLFKLHFITDLWNHSTFHRNSEYTLPKTNLLFSNTTINGYYYIKKIINGIELRVFTYVERQKHTVLTVIHQEYDANLKEILLRKKPTYSNIHNKWHNKIKLFVNYWRQRHYPRHVKSTDRIFSNCYLCNLRGRRNTHRMKCCPPTSVCVSSQIPMNGWHHLWLIGGEDSMPPES